MKCLGMLLLIAKCIVPIKRATTYNPTFAQCDATPLNTADGSFIDTVGLKNGTFRWVALSRDLINDSYRDKLYSNNDHWKGHFEFGDTLRVISKTCPTINGEWVVHDCMAPRYSRSIDFLMDPVQNNPKVGVLTDLIILKK